MPYGRNVLGQSGYPILALATDPKSADWKVGGLTLDWATVTAVGADTLLLDGSTIKNGQKYLRWGQVVCRANTAEVQTITATGGPTGGTFTATVPAYGAFPAATTPEISVTATGAVVEAALEALPNVGQDGASVARTGTGAAGTPYVWTITFNRNLGNVPQVTVTVVQALTGGTTPSIDPATTTAGTGTGLFGPYDPTATDGRQTLVRGECFVLNELVTQFPTIGFGQPDADHPAGFDGGTVWKDRIIATLGAHSLADGPTLTEFEAAFPRIGYVEN